MGRRGEDNKDEVAFDYTLLCAQAKNLLKAYWAMDKKPAPCSSHPEVQLDLQSNELAKRLQDSITLKDGTLRCTRNHRQYRNGGSPSPSSP